MADPQAWTAEQLDNARTIASVGRQMGMSPRDIQIALMTALQESTLRNLDYGDRDSVGLFQQRASWGALSDRMNPQWSARQFYQHLARIGHRNDLEMWQAAQKVQISAFPTAYAKWADDAETLLGRIGGQAPNQQTQPSPQLQNPLASAMDKILSDDASGGASDPASTPTTPGLDVEQEQWSPSPNWNDLQAVTPAPDLFSRTGTEAGQTSGLRSAVATMAKKYIGIPYVFGASGPDAFDCSSFTQWVFSEMGIKLPRLAYQQAQAGQLTSLSGIRAGDLVFWGNYRRQQGNHVALYLGDGMIIEAPRPGLSVRIRRLRDDEDAMGVKLDY